MITKSRLTIAQRSLVDRGAAKVVPVSPKARIAVGALPDSHRRSPGGCPAATRGRQDRPEPAPARTNLDLG